MRGFGPRIKKPRKKELTEPVKPGEFWRGAGVGEARRRIRAILPLLDRVARNKHARLVLKVGLMAKSNTIQIKLNSSADTGVFYVTRKNTRTKTGKLEFRKYDPKVRKHVAFKEGKIK